MLNNTQILMVLESLDLIAYKYWDEFSELYLRKFGVYPSALEFNLIEKELKLDINNTTNCGTL